MPPSYIEIIQNSFTVIFFLITASYYVLLFWKKAESKQEKNFTSITIIIPAHNEESLIESSIRSAQRADFPGAKEIIVVDDGSTDRTAEIVSKIEGVTLIQTRHAGKSNSLNLALSRAQGEIIAIIDGDTEIAQNGLVGMKEELEKENVAASTCPILVKNRNTHVLMWLHMEMIYGSLLRLIMSKVNANITVSGQFCAFRRAELQSVGGFSTRTLSEDVDVTVRLLRAGYHMGYTEKAIAYTNLPTDFGGLLRQRVRWVKGSINIMLTHVRMSRNLLDIYALPLLVFGYLQAVILGSITFAKVGTDYWRYFASKGEYLSPQVCSFFFDWLSVFGMLKWSFGIFTGATAVNALTIIGILAALMSYPLYFICIFKFDKKFDLRHAIPLLFMTPLWWTVMAIQILSCHEIFKDGQANIWLKNEGGGLAIQPRESKTLIDSQEIIGLEPDDKCPKLPAGFGTNALETSSLL